MTRGPRDELAEKMAGEVTLSTDPGATLRKWRTDFEIAQTDLATELDVSPSVVSDYESGRRENPGIGVIRRIVDCLLDIDERRGSTHIRQHARVLSAGFDSEVVHDLREYSANIPLERYYEAIDGTELARGDRDTVAGPGGVPRRRWRRTPARRRRWRGTPGGRGPPRCRTPRTAPARTGGCGRRRGPRRCPAAPRPDGGRRRCRGCPGGRSRSRRRRRVRRPVGRRGRSVRRRSRCATSAGSPRGRR